MKSTLDYYCKKILLYEKSLYGQTTLRSPFIRGSPPMKEIKYTFRGWLLSDNTTVKKFALWKVALRTLKFAVPVFKGGLPPLKKWNPPFGDDFSDNTTVTKIRSMKSDCNGHTTLRSPFIRGLPHEKKEINTTRLLLADSNIQNISLYKHRLYELSTLRFPFIRASPSMKELKSTLRGWLLSDYTAAKKFHCMKSD